MPVPYLCTVHYAGKDSPGTVNDDWLAGANALPMDGLWLNFEPPYNEGPPVTLEQSAGVVAKLRDECRKDVWPVVYLNRITQFVPGRAHESTADRRYQVFQKIRGWDLDDDQGMRSALLEVWRQQLRVARALGAGLAFDFIAVDFTGHPRGDRFDIGAYQHN
jgi:hypothetical protein